MRLLRIYIKRHILLRDLDLRFDRPGRLDSLDEGRYSLDFFVGLNGSGKSTLLRALTQIIVDLRSDRATDFDYTIDYEIAGVDGPYFVSIEQDREHKGASIKTMIVRHRDANGSVIYNQNAIDRNYLPNLLAVYTTGSEAGWEKIKDKMTRVEDGIAAKDVLLNDPIERILAEAPGHFPSMRQNDLHYVIDTKAPYVFFRSTRLPAITLCGLLAHISSNRMTLQAVLKSAGFGQMIGFSLSFRLHSALSSFETFNKLQTHATRHIQQGTRHVLIFDLSIDGNNLARQLLSEFGDSGLELFEQLDRMSEVDLSRETSLQEVDIFLERHESTGTQKLINEESDISRIFLFSWLSDGEQNFLARMALLNLFDANDSIILLDEPEVHFNDYWKREIVNFLDQIVRERSNHIIITTHSSIMLSDVSSAQVTVLIREESGWSRSTFLRIPLLAVDPSDIMVNLFGVQRAVGAYSTNLLHELVEKGDKHELEALLDIVGPGYWRYRIQDRLERINATSS